MKKHIYPSQKIGITEAGEPAYNLGIFRELYRANIIITKSLTDALIDKLLENKMNIILHLTCTGFGGSVLEPFVPTKEKTYSQFLKLIDKGFPVDQVVLRIDPCIPTIKGKQTAYEVARLFSGHGIKRLRFSSLDIYNHVKERFNTANIALPYSSFHASESARIELLKGLKTIGETYGYTIEACGEPGIPSVPCLSQKDLQILGLEEKIELIGNAEQRKACNCPANKTELIRNTKPHQCENKCLYCFWKN